MSRGPSTVLQARLWSQASLETRKGTRMSILEEVEEAARRLPEKLRTAREHSNQPPQAGSPPISARRPSRKQVEIEENWDVWETDRVTTHRGIKGLPVVVVKKMLLALLKPYSRELLKRQRAYNEAVKTELIEIRQELATLRAKLDGLS